MDPTIEVDSASQHSISCTECQRRKQKCSRTWPCNHCQSRKVPHMCHFASKKASVAAEAMPSSSSNMSRKRKGPEVEGFASSTGGNSIKDEVDLSAADAMKALGYLQLAGDPQLFAMLSEHQIDKLDQEVELATKDVPPRVYCDAIVQNFLDICNYWYYVIYPPQFLEAYNAWWENRSKRRRNRPEFTCLILRVCACSTQCIKPALKVRLETELGEGLQELTTKYDAAASRLSKAMKPGIGGLTEVQQLFMTAVWLKAECLFVNSWHALGDAIRYAQEIGMHNESYWTGLSEFDCEIRRRIWCSLTIWDRFMGMMLSRPLLINDKQCHVKLPSVNLEHDPAYPSLESPIKHMELQCRLVKGVIQIFDGSKQQVNVGEVMMVLSSVNQWLAELPPIYREDTKHPDKRFDKSHPYLVLQRLQTVNMGYNTIVSPLRPYLTNTHKSDPGLDTKTLRDLQLIAIEKCMLLMEISQQLADLYIPDYNKYFLIVFTPFDTSALLCSAILHDVDKTLPRRNDILKAIVQGLSIMRRLKTITKTGAVAENVLVSLISKFSLTPTEQTIFTDATVAENPPATKRRLDSDSSNSTSISHSTSITPPIPDNNASQHQLSTGTSISGGSVSASISSGSLPTGTQLTPPELVDFQFSLNESAVPLDAGQLENLRFDLPLGPLEPVFDWSTINLFGPDPEVFDFGGAP